MRILANYGCRTNGDSYSVTFETMGDVPQDQASKVVDDLFALAKEAVQRQIEGNSYTDDEDTHNNNGNGNGRRVMNPEAEPTEAQLNYIEKLAKKAGRKINLAKITTRGEASEIIEELRH